MGNEKYMTQSVCESLVFEDSWVWYCDECQVHGVETNPESAHDMAVYHADRLTHVFLGNPEDDDRLLEEDSNAWYEQAVSVSTYELSERADLRIEHGVMCDLYIISDKHNKAFSVDYTLEGDEAVAKKKYANTKPHKIENLEAVNELRKKLGLP